MAKQDIILKFPAINNGWLFRWRREYGLSRRLVTLRFKVQPTLVRTYSTVPPHCGHAQCSTVLHTELHVVMPLCQCQSSRNFTLHFIFHLPQVSKSKLLRRLRVTLLNGIRLRTLWGKCFPGRPFRVVSFDQKPFWFNSVGSEATLSLKGSRGVQVVENMCATRERWTFMSTAQLQARLQLLACSRLLLEPQ